MLREYETICVLQSQTPDDGLKELEKRFQDLVKKNKGEILVHRNLGRNKLAYAMSKKENEGIYLHFDYVGQGDLVAEIERTLRLDERVMRFLTHKLGEKVDVKKRKAELKKSESETAEKEAKGE